MYRDVRKPNFGWVSVFKNRNRTESKRSNPKFRFPWLFQNRTCLIQIVIIWAILTNTMWFKLKFKLNLKNMHLRPIEHLENCRPKYKMHTQERQLTRFFVIYNWSTKKTEPTVFENQTEPEPNPRFFSKPNRTWKIHSAHPWFCIICDRWSSHWNIDALKCH